MEVKKFKNYIREFVEGEDSKSDNLIDAKMEELSELIKSVSTEKIMYEWKNEDNHKLHINFIYDEDEEAISFEFDIDNLNLTKIEGDEVSYSESVNDIEEGLDIIEQDIYMILGVHESQVLNFRKYSILEKNVPTDNTLWQKALRWVKGTKHGGSATVRHDGEVYDAPNDGKGYDVYPSAYSNGAAVKMYNKWGGSWKKSANESLDKWFDEDWVRIDTQGNIAGDCGTMPDGKRMQRCLPRKKAKSMTKAERKATTAKKTKGDKKGKQFVANTDKAKVSKVDRKKARK